MLFFFARLRRAIKDILFAFSSTIAYGSLKISAKDEKDFGQDEIDIMEKNEDGNSEKMKMTSSLKKMRMEIALFPTLRGGGVINYKWTVLPQNPFSKLEITYKEDDFSIFSRLQISNRDFTAADENFENIITDF